MDGGRRARVLDAAARGRRRDRRGRSPRPLCTCPTPRCSAACWPGWSAGLAGRTRLAVPRPAMTAAQAVVGVSIGALVQLSTLDRARRGLAARPAGHPGDAAAQPRRRAPPAAAAGISPVTGAFSMIAGGASGITAMARDLGADARMVAVLQYLRVLLIVVLMPVVATTSTALGVRRRRRGRRERAGLGGRRSCSPRSARRSGSSSPDSCASRSARCWVRCWSRPPPTSPGSRTAPPCRRSCRTRPSS